MNVYVILSVSVLHIAYALGGDTVTRTDFLIACIHKRFAEHNFSMDNLAEGQSEDIIFHEYMDNGSQVVYGSLKLTKLSERTVDISSTMTIQTKDSYDTEVDSGAQKNDLKLSLLDMEDFSWGDEWTACGCRGYFHPRYDQRVYTKARCTCHSTIPMKVFNQEMRKIDSR